MECDDKGEIELMISNSLKNRIDKHEIISFDVYDTLVSRNVKKPSDVFCLIEKQYNKKFGAHKAIKGFKENRIKAYEDVYSCYGSSCSIDKIYDRLTDYSDEAKTELKKIEINIEQDICCGNYKIFEIYKYALSKKKRIFIISDIPCTFFTRFSSSSICFPVMLSFNETCKLYLKISPYCDGIILLIASLIPKPVNIRAVHPITPIIVIKNLFLYLKIFLAVTF